MGPRAAASPGMPVQANRATHTGGVIRSGSQPTVTQGKPIVNISAESATQMVQRNQDRGMQWIPFWGEVDVPHLKGAKQQEGHPVHTAHIQGTCIQRCFQHLHSPPPEQGHRKSCSARAYAHICRPASGLASRARLPYTVSHAGGGVHMHKPAGLHQDPPPAPIAHASGSRALHLHGSCPPASPGTAPWPKPLAAPEGLCSRRA